MAWKRSENLCEPRRGVIETNVVWEWYTKDLTFTVHWADGWVLMCSQFRIAEPLFGIEQADECRAKLVGLRKVFAAMRHAADAIREEGTRLAELVKEVA